MSQAGFDTVVIGGGVIGLFTAWELSKQGQLVCVLEAGEFGQEASWAAGGILSPLRPWEYPSRVNQLASESQKLYPQICEELKESTGIDCEWRQSGMLILDCADQTAAQAWADKAGQRIEWLNDANIQTRFPGVRRRKPGVAACLLPEVAQLRNPRLIKALLAQLRMRGVECRAQSRVEGLCVESGRVTTVELGGRQIQAESVVIAAGAWSSQIVAAGAQLADVLPVKGQMLLFAAGAKPPPCMLMQGGRYLIPRADGRMVAGSTVEHAGFDKFTDDEALAQIRADISAMWPALKDAQIEMQWAGLRPATADEQPLIGPHGSIRGLYLNTGHYRSGIVMAPASAKAVAEMIAQGSGR